MTFDFLDKLNDKIFVVKEIPENLKNRYCVGDFVSFGKYREESDNFIIQIFNVLESVHGEEIVFNKYDFSRTLFNKYFEYSEEATAAFEVVLQSADSESLRYNKLCKDLWKKAKRSLYISMGVFIFAMVSVVILINLVTLDIINISLASRIAVVLVSLAILIYVVCKKEVQINSLKAELTLLTRNRYIDEYVHTHVPESLNAVKERLKNENFNH